MNNKKGKKNKLAKLMIQILIVIILGGLLIGWWQIKKEKDESEEIEVSANSTENSVLEIALPQKKEITDWRLQLVNCENPLPEDFNVELANIDKTRKFDQRAIGELNQMLQAMKNDGIYNIWIQSAYRSIEYQEDLYQKSLEKYQKMGKTKEEAEQLTSLTLQKPRESEHHLGLAVDFNYVENEFETTRAYQWLLENADQYGFILRYPKEKEEITKISFEPWHWRYVGKEHARIIKERNFCLEEYIEDLQG